MIKFMSKTEYEEWVEKMENFIVDSDTGITALDLWEGENPFTEIYIVND